MRLGKLLSRLGASPDFRGLLVASVATILVGAVFYHHQEGLGWLDAVYFTVITLTTVGYGDFSPATDGGKVFTMLYILLGLGIVGALVAVIADAAVGLAGEATDRG